LCIAFPGQGAYELAYQAGFGFVMSGDPVRECRVMLPSERSIRNDHGVLFDVVGELAGQYSWRDKTHAGEQAGARAAQNRQPSTKG
jgi:hypothetical protein